MKLKDAFVSLETLNAEPRTRRPFRFQIRHEATYRCLEAASLLWRQAAPVA